MLRVLGCTGLGFTVSVLGLKVSRTWGVLPSNPNLPPSTRNALNLHPHTVLAFSTS